MIRTHDPSPYRIDITRWMTPTLSWAALWHERRKEFKAAVLHDMEVALKLDADELSASILKLGADPVELERRNYVDRWLEEQRQPGYLVRCESEASVYTCWPVKPNGWTGSRVFALEWATKDDEIYRPWTCADAVQNYYVDGLKGSVDHEVARELCRMRIAAVSTFPARLRILVDVEAVRKPGGATIGYDFDAIEEGEIEFEARWLTDEPDGEPHYETRKITLDPLSDAPKIAFDEVRGAYELHLIDRTNATTPLVVRRNYW